MTSSRIVIRPTRRVVDLLRNRRYRIYARFPGGREVDKGHAETRPRAFKKALVAARVQTSLTAAGGSGQYAEQVAGQPPEVWRRYFEDVIY